MDKSVVHFSAYWNMDADFDELAPKGMKLWAENLKQMQCRSETERYTWYGKVSFRSLGILPEEIVRLDEQIRRQNSSGRETHLYLYTYLRTADNQRIPYSLHVGKVLELRGQEVYDEKDERPHMPLKFYSSMLENEALKERAEVGEAIPFFWRLEDLRELPHAEAKNLVKETHPYTRQKPFDFLDKLSPAKIYQLERRDYFQETGWWDEVLTTSRSGELDPGQFMTESVRQVYSQALQFADEQFPVLILGERGTGKTSMARFIRRNSLYKRLGKYSTEWPSLSCGDFESPERLWSSIFGHKGHVFPFAFDDSDGLLKDAHEETFLLDEIEHLPHHLQRLVIRAFDEKHYRPADSTKTIASEFRLLVTTSIPPDQLYQKIDSRFLDTMGAVIKMPPLTDFSIDDKMSVWRHMFDLARRTVFGDEYEQAPESALSEDDEQRLLKILHNHPLHGNFRDVKRLAFHVALALKFRKTRPDSEQAFSAQLWIRDALDWTGYEVTGFSRPSVNLARAFSQAIPLDKALDTDLLKNVSELIDRFTEEVRRFVGMEVRRIAKARAVKLEEVCEVPNPSGIAKWIKGRRKRKDVEVTDH